MVALGMLSPDLKADVELRGGLRRFAGHARGRISMFVPDGPCGESRPARKIARSLIDLGGCHLSRDVSHLLADVVPARTRCKGLEMSLDVDSRLSVEPRGSELGVGRAMTGRADRDVAHRRAAGDDLRSIDSGIGMRSGLTRQI